MKRLKVFFVFLFVVGLGIGLKWDNVKAEEIEPRYVIHEFSANSNVHTLAGYTVKHWFTVSGSCKVVGETHSMLTVETEWKTENPGRHRITPTDIMLSGSANNNPRIYTARSMIDGYVRDLKATVSY